MQSINLKNKRKQKQKYHGCFKQTMIFVISSGIIELVQTVVVVIVLHGFNFTKEVTISDLREEVVVGSSC